MTVTTLIIDDEPLVRLSIIRWLRADPDISIVGECSDGRSAVLAIREKRPQLVFLDMHLPEMNGLRVIAEIGADHMPVTVFTTAHQQYALDAFESGAVDYILKPFGKEAVERAVKRAKQRIAMRDQPQVLSQLNEALQRMDKQDAYVDRLAVTVKGRILFIDVDTVDWIRAESNNVLLHVGPKQFDMRMTLSGLEQKLDPRKFVRIHRSTIVNLKRIQEIHPWTNGHHLVVLDTGERLRMSRYEHEVLEKLMSN